ncbi:MULTISPECIES: magnesium-translocating P-type ATPase [Pseudomonas]|jgi:Mg2+-importing ATPase|uniref:Magnesium-transporting ATPase, P-type 1 n=1 Tax=Pseudomonas rhodesiae TaxID=76760 RepID=A0A8I1E1S5_9PSED|nr:MULTISPECIES: magnesium-translocating P-type ATPase [Pseudomonas]MBI6603172.1 magnesium-translocating P-type ATPase [Pseudomonas sp. S4_EA_1b]MBI6623562.1 magnesium-translocating P-type ATPase [Pseudomonas rhodesiae]MBX4135451.1 magnesium-translocating P-type ATPase [Pseudomonas sp. S5F11]MDN6865446.1 magnesium-translocating P-type ATPase [Pseudomonas rhodesiae]NMY82186.1 magnesium-translocating P-type ATPase [Pseudomonas rhodesiae]
MNLALLKEFFAGFLRTRHIARHFRRLAMLETVNDASVSREVPPTLAQTLVGAANSSAVQLLGTLGSHTDGLTAAEADALRVQYGLNEVEHEQPLPWWVHLWHCYKNPFNLLLTLLAVISWLTEDMKAATVIFSMVVLSTLLRFWQEAKSNKAADALKAMVSNTATVLRRDDGKRIELPIKQLVPGDLIVLSAGDMIPADCRVLSAKDLFVSQAAMTGESMPVEKFALQQDAQTRNPLDLENILFMGTNVVSGAATAVILTTGNSTYFGALAQRVTATDRATTSFQHGVNKVSWLLIRFMFVMAPLVLFINGFTKGDWTEALLFALSIAVGLTPEMLPMIVTSTLAKGAVFLSRKKVIVKRLDAIQNFGAMDVLCTDKTGTLTQDKIFLARHVDVWGEESDDVLEMAYLNSYYQTGLKNLLDVAVLEHVEVHRELKVGTAFQKVDEIPFDFNRRRMSVVVAEQGLPHLLICKGAVEEILSVCNSVRHGDTNEALTEELLARIRQVTAAFNEEGLRVVAVAARPMTAGRDTYSLADENDLTLIGYVAFLDPPKESTAPALKALKAHGVAVKVLTGDNELVTAKICREVGLEQQGLLMGNDIEAMTDAELAVAVETTNVFAKLTPAHKERIVRLLKANGHVVGFMGDGINDAPALRTADIGISVDSAVDIAKEAADIILLEKSLMILEEGVLEGRRTFANMLKYIKMTASSNFGNVFSVLVASAFIPFLPMLPMHLLVQNLLYDISQIAIPFDNVDADMLAKPQRWQPGDVGRFMLFFGPISSIFDITTFALMWYVFDANTPDHQTLFQSGWFVVGLLTQTLIVHMIRTPKIPFLQSRAALPLMVMTGVIMAVGIFLPMGPLAHYFKLQALPSLYFVFLPVILLAYMGLTQAVKGYYIRKFGWQ